ncbi:glycosyltransferase family 2 protein [Pedococcus sp. 2YAF34]|uniref:glycosyltransferase family 2 protein n=1 Tax=Pedococcus sp. 2YAF34 TaxID=3233032 RepID=UPI003F99D1EB
MSAPFPSPYSTDTSPIAAATVPVSVIVLTLDEEANIARCLASLAWASQVVVVDSGSNDRTVEIARTHGATIIETHWRGFGQQREYAMRLAELKHQWIYVVDADEWVSENLAAEIADTLKRPEHAAYWQYFRLVFQGRWIAHCGWYPSARSIRLMDRGRCGYSTEVFSEHPVVNGPMGRLHEDIIDHDLKGLAAWTRKHVRYAELEAKRREDRAPRVRMPHESRLRFFLKDRVAPRIPFRPLATFLYMYILRGGFRDGRQGLLFCSLHAWFQMLVQALMREREQASVPASATNARTQHHAAY